MQAILIIVVSLSLAGVVAAAAKRRKPKPQCACFEFVGDNPRCPVPDHRSTARAWERIGKRSGWHWVGK